MRSISLTLIALVALPGLLAGCGGQEGSSEDQDPASAGKGGGAGAAGSGASAGNGSAGSSAGSGGSAAGSGGSAAGSGGSAAGSGGSAAGSGGSAAGSAGAAAGSGAAGAGGQAACKPGESKPADDGCNTCTCTNEGSWACTDMACPIECTGSPPSCEVPPDGCAYVGSGCVNGQWTCGELVCQNQCKVDSDCPAIKMACQQCPGGGQSCPSSDCVNGQCKVVWSGCGGGVGPGLPCNKPGAQAPADDGCNTCVCADSGTWSCTKIACPECSGAPPPCAAPPDGCDYVGGGCVNGQWTCGELVCQNQCKADSDCPQSDAPCQLCPDGSTACPSTSCIGGQCVTSFQGCAGPCEPQDAAGDGLCGAFFGYAWNGASCVSVSGCKCVGTDCGSLYKTPDQCKLAHEGCSGSQCKVDSDCPAIKMPCQQCSDGGLSCPSSDCVNGQCQVVWSGCGGGVGPGLPCNKPGAQAPADDGCNTCVCADSGTWSCTKIACPECTGAPPPCAAPPDGCDYVGGGCVNGQWTCGELVCQNQCKVDSDCPAIKMPCELCPGGGQSCPSSDCVNGQCKVVWSGCSSMSCAPQEIKGIGSCKKLLGYAWNGLMCNAVTGCECAGDCDSLFASQDTCNKAYATCQ